MPIDAVTASVLALLLGVLLYGPWQWACTDFARQIVFEKRDAIFDMAASGRLNFKSSEYRKIRSSLEASIRFAHEMTLPRVAWLWFLFVRKRMPVVSDLQSAISAIREDDVRDEVKRLVTEANVAMVVWMVAKSPVVLSVVLALLPVAILALLIVMFAQGCRLALRKAAAFVADLVQVEAEAVGGESPLTVGAGD